MAPIPRELLALHHVCPGSLKSSRLRGRGRSFSGLFAPFVINRHRPHRAGRPAMVFAGGWWRWWPRRWQSYRLGYPAGGGLLAGAAGWRLG